MASFMAPWQAQTYAAMRIVAGFLFMWHGSQKLFDFPIPQVGSIPAYITWIAGPIELVGGTLVMLGLFTRWAGFLCSGLMAVAYWGFHAEKALTPLENKGELAILYCFVFFFISARGGGLWSVDGSRGEN